MDSLKVVLEESSKERDFIAYKIINSFEKYSGLLERTEIEQDSLLKYAVYGEVRQLALKHKLSKTIERRLELSHEIYHMVGEKEKFSKPIYGILKGMGLEVSRLRFEKEWYCVYQEKGSIPFKNVDDLSKAFVSLETQRKSQKTTEDFTILKASSEQQSRIVKENSSLQTQAKAIETALQQNMTGFADSIFASIGEPYHRASSSSTERRYGKKGHISLNLKTGAWIDYKDSHLSGGPLHLLTKLKGMSFKEAIDYGASWAGLSPKEILALPQTNQISSTKESIQQQDSLDHKNRIEKAKALWNKGQPITGTLAENYLKQHRKIEGTLPSDLRFLPAFKDKSSGKSFPCLMAAARSVKGDITAVQITSLDSVTGEKAKIEVPKKSLGIIKGSAVTIQACPIERGEENLKVLFIAEGVETALSLKEAGLRGDIKASLGLSNIKRLVPENPNTSIIICADHDVPGSSAAKSLERSVSELQERGFTVTVIKPEKLKEDFNDVLKEKGSQGVRESLKKALPPELRDRVFDFDYVKNNPEKLSKETTFKEKSVDHSKSEPVKSSEKTIESHPFEELQKQCEKHLYDYLKKENRPLTSDLQKRLKLQAEKAANFIFYAHRLKACPRELAGGMTPTQEETRLYLLRAKYELDRIPEIRRFVLKEWDREGRFDESDIDAKSALIAHMTAERQASIEGKIYFKAKQKGLHPPLNIEDIAKQKLDKHRSQTKDLAQKISEKYSISEKSAIQCAKNILRYKETHGEKPTSEQIGHMIKISRELEKNYSFSKAMSKSEIEFLRRREADTLFRKAPLQKDFSNPSETKDLQSLAKQEMQNLLKVIRQDLAHIRQKEMSL